MKIEKINDNQIRCTLTREDLEIHQIQLSELAYGSDKARQLFKDMMQQAQAQFGFEANNIPLMIEAIPVSAESIVLIITKVEDPEELDTRFSKFSPYKNQGQKELHLDGADNIIDLIQKLCDTGKNAQKKAEDTAKKVEKEKEIAPATEKIAAPEPKVNLIRLYTFTRLDELLEASRGLRGCFHGENTLYKDNRQGLYKLVIHQSDCTPEEFNKICNILSEYGPGQAFTASGEAYLMEHEELIAVHALQTLEQV